MISPLLGPVADGAIQMERCGAVMFSKLIVFVNELLLKVMWASLLGLADDGSAK